MRAGKALLPAAMEAQEMRLEAMDPARADIPGFTM